MAQSTPTAPDWRRYHAAIVAGTMLGEIPMACERAWAWLTLPQDERTAAIRAAIRSEAAARWQLQALPFVRIRLLRDAGIDPNHPQWPSASQAGSAKADLTQGQQAAKAITDEVATLFPGAVLPPAEDDTQRQQLLARTPALSQAMHACDVARATPQALEQLHAAIAAFDAAGTDAHGTIAREQAWWLGLAWWAAARAALELRRTEAGRDALQRAQACYAQAGETQAAAECAEGLRDLNERHAGDFDSAAGRRLSALLVRSDPLGRVRALTGLAHIAGGAGDRFEAARLGEEAAATLAAAGYPDPEADFDAAAWRWISTVIDSCTGNDVIARLCEIAQHWSTILGARASRRMEDDPGGSAQAQLVLSCIPPWAMELIAQAGRAEELAAERHALWYPPPPGADALSTRSAGSDSLEHHRALATLDEELAELRDACNQRAEDGLVDEARALRERAQALDSRIHVTRAFLEESYVLLALQRHTEAIDRARQALSCLLGDAAPRLGAFATGHERELYLSAITYQARALAATQDHAAIIALCEPVMRDLEIERQRVNSPYQQNAFLATRTELYEFVAASAYCTQHLDLLLEVSELLKSRAALRRRQTPGAAPEAAELDAALRQVNEALATATPGSAGGQALRERRRWLFTSRGLTRAQAAGALPQVTLAALQAALAPDEAAITWFWLGTNTLIVLAIRTDGTSRQAIRLTPEQQGKWEAYLGCVKALADAAPHYTTLIPQIEALITELGPWLLPEPIRLGLKDKARLILCPHRGLHLFAFHALSDQGRPLIARHAIRYVPSLTSLLLPWSGNNTGPVLAVGVSHFADPALRTLPNAEAEAAEVAALHGPQGSALTGPTRAQFLNAPLESLRCLHLATHGSSVLAGPALDDPLDCALYLRDAAISGWDLATLRLPAELVVLASCHSGQRLIAGRGLEQLPGDDLFGLPAMLCEAGAGHLLGALWPADDQTARSLACDFHRAYARGMAPDLALQSAVRTHLADPRRPQSAFHWAPFTLSAFGRPE